LYKTCTRDSELKGIDVVAECTPLPAGEKTVHETGITTEEIRVDPIAMEVPSLEECHGLTHRASLGSELVKTNSESLSDMLSHASVPSPPLAFPCHAHDPSCNA
jgi:hypothetical protein